MWEHHSINFHQIIIKVVLHLAEDCFISEVNVTRQKMTTALQVQYPTVLNAEDITERNCPDQYMVSDQGTVQRHNGCIIDAVPTLPNFTKVTLVNTP